MNRLIKGLTLAIIICSSFSTTALAYLVSSFTANPPTIGIDENGEPSSTTSTLTAQLSAVWGYPLDGWGVTFQITAGQGTLTNADSTTHDGGKASVTYNCPDSPVTPQKVTIHVTINVAQSPQKDCDVWLVGVEVTSADVTQDKIHVDLQPNGLSGSLKLELTGPGSSHTIREATRSSGSYDETFDIPNLATGEYTKVKATWTVGGYAFSDEYDYHINVLGNYEITVYNTPLESDFSGGTTNVKTVTSSGSWSSMTYKTSFLNETCENGSGKGSDSVIIGIEWYFVPPDYEGHPPPEGYPPMFEYNGNEYDFRRPAIVVGATGIPLEIDTSVAIKPNHPFLTIGNSVYVHELGLKQVHDHGGELVEAQLDLYKGFGQAAVEGWPNPVKKVIKIY